MFGLMAFAALLGALLGMGLLAWLIDHVEAPLHDQGDELPADRDLALVDHAKRGTKTGRQRLN